MGVWYGRRIRKFSGSSQTNSLAALRFQRSRTANPVLQTETVGDNVSPLGLVPDAPEDGIKMNGSLKRCPRCTSQETFRSHRRGFIERWVLPSFRMRPYRCIKCDTRFYAISQFEGTASSAKAA